MCKKSYLPYMESHHLIDLQTLNGVNRGNILYSTISCNNINNHGASEMHKELINHILNSKSKFSILIDESTSVASRWSIIVYACTRIHGEIMPILFSIQANRSNCDFKTLLKLFDDIGLSQC